MDLTNNNKDKCCNKENSGVNLNNLTELSRYIPDYIADNDLDQKLGICSTATHRGCIRSGHSLSISVLSSIRTTSSSTRGVNTDNLKLVSKAVYPESAKLAVINCRSTRNKSAFITSHILDNHLDLIALTETWLTSDDQQLLEQSLLMVISYTTFPALVARGEV